MHGGGAKSRRCYLIDEGSTAVRSRTMSDFLDLITLVSGSSAVKVRWLQRMAREGPRSGFEFGLLREIHIALKFQLLNPYSKCEI